MRQCVYRLLAEIEIDPQNYYYSSNSGMLFNKSGDVLIHFPNIKSNVSVDIPSFITEIYHGAFAYNSSLTSLIINGNIKTISDGAFLGCVNLKQVVLNEGVSVIGSQVFKDCASLRDVFLPRSLILIRYKPFENCNDVTFYVHQGSYAEIWARENNFKFTFIE